MVIAILDFARMEFFCTFADKNMQKHVIKQREAIIEALTLLGGKAKMSQICKLAIEIGDFSGSESPDNTVRNCIYTNPKHFRSSGVKGYWELVSYNEEIAKRDRRIKELEEENCRLRSVKTQDEFVRDLLEGTKKFFKHERQKTVAICQILGQMGQTEASEELDAWIEGKEYKPSVNIHVHGNLNDVHGNKSVNF